MKYAVIKCINGNFFIDSEGFTDKARAIVSYYRLCINLWNADDVITADAMIVDERLCRIGEYYEHIDKNKNTDTTSAPEFPI